MTLCNWLKISECEVYWLMDFPLDACQRKNYNDLSFEVVYALIIKKQANKYKENSNFIVDRDHSSKESKEKWVSYTPADILVRI